MNDLEKEKALDGLTGICIFLIAIILGLTMIFDTFSLGWMLIALTCLVVALISGYHSWKLRNNRTDENI